MATSISATGFKGNLCSSFHGTWATSIVGEDYAMLVKSVPSHVRVGKPIRAQPMMKNVNEGKGIFAPAVVVARNIIGKKRFNQIRGKAIALHSQVINMVLIPFLTSFQLVYTKLSSKLILSLETWLN